MNDNHYPTDATGYFTQITVHFYQDPVTENHVVKFVTPLNPGGTGFVQTGNKGKDKSLLRAWFREARDCPFGFLNQLLWDNRLWLNPLVSEHEDSRLKDVYYELTKCARIDPDVRQKVHQHLDKILEGEVPKPQFPVSFRTLYSVWKDKTEGAQP